MCGAYRSGTRDKPHPLHIRKGRNSRCSGAVYCCCCKTLWPRPLLQEQCIMRTAIVPMRTRRHGWVWWSVRVKILRSSRISALFPPLSCSKWDRKFPCASLTGASFTTPSSATSCTAVHSGNTPTSRCSPTRCCFHLCAKWDISTPFTSHHNKLLSCGSSDWSAVHLPAGPCARRRVLH